MNNAQTTTYGISYSVSRFEETLAEHDPNVRAKLEARKLIAETRLDKEMKALSQQESRPHQISFGEWHSYQNEDETVYQKKGWLNLY